MTVSSVSGIYYLKLPKVTLAPGELWTMLVTFLYLKNHMYPLYLHFPSSSFSFFFSLFRIAYNKKLVCTTSTEQGKQRKSVEKSEVTQDSEVTPFHTTFYCMIRCMIYGINYIKLASQLKSELWDTVNWARKWLVDFDTEKI